MEQHSLRLLTPPSPAAGLQTLTTRLSNNRVTDDYGTIGGGGGNRAGNDDGDPENAQFATVAGGMKNKAEKGYRRSAVEGSNNVAVPSGATAGGDETK